MFKRILPILLAAIVLAAGAAWALQPAAGIRTRASLSSVAASADTRGYARVAGPRPLVFPADHGPHPEYQTEWWYYTGNMADAAGRHFGFQLTIFRRAIAPPGGAPPADGWTTSQVYFAHFAVTDTGGNHHAGFEKLARGAAGLAGASGVPFRAWIGGWSAEALDASASQMHLRAAEGGYGIDLDVSAAKPVVLHGDGGVSAKSPEPGNASFYYSHTRLATRGTISTPDGTFSVTGLSWMDHEWSTSVLGKDAVGWDWFAIQLGDQRELMIYGIRNADGSYDPVSGGTLVEPDGTARPFTRADMTLQPVATWRNTDASADYPVAWKVSLPRFGIALDVEPRLRDQEMRTGSGNYWEGAILARGTSAGRPVTGAGYLELTGYRESMKGWL